MKLPPALDNLQNIKHAKVIGLLLAIFVNIGLVAFNAFFPSTASYYILLAGTVGLTFFFLYVFGVRQGKWLAAMGITVFIIIGMVNGLLIVHTYYSQDEPDHLDSSLFVDWDTREVTDIDDGNLTHDGYWYYLEDGTLTPYKDAAGQQYTLSITLYSDDPFIDPPDVRASVAKFLWGDYEIPLLTEVDPADTNYVNGKDFQATINMPENWIYFHGFALVFDGTTTTPSSLNTTLALGPLVGPETGLYVPLAGIGLVSMFCNVGLLFLIIVLLYWWIGTAKEKRKSWLEETDDKDDAKKGTRKEAPPDDDADDEDDETVVNDQASDEGAPSDEGEFTCTTCGSSVSASHNFCPQCGEKFEGIEDEPPTEDEKEA